MLLNEELIFSVSCIQEIPDPDGTAGPPPAEGFLPKQSLARHVQKTRCFQYTGKTGWQRMISVFNRAELFVDTDPEAAAKVWSVLRESGIEYEMKTDQNLSAFRKNLHYNQGIQSTKGGMSGSYFGDMPGYVYRIYVKKKDYSRSKELCSL